MDNTEQNYVERKINVKTTFFAKFILSHFFFKHLPFSILRKLLHIFIPNSENQRNFSVRLGLQLIHILLYAGLFY